MSLTIQIIRHSACALLSLVLLTSVPAQAQQGPDEQSAQANKPKKFVRGRGTDDSAENALHKAKIAAWKDYLGSLQGAKLDNIMANEATFLGDINNYIVGVNVIESKCEGAFSKTCVATIKATVNDTLVDSRLRQATQGVGTVKASASDYIAFLVIARVSDEQLSFETRVTQKVESTVGTSGSEASAEAVSGNRSGTAEAAADAASVTQTAKTVRGGSQLDKADQITYKAWPSIEDLQNRVGEELTNNSISTIPWEDLVNKCQIATSDTFSKQYAESENGRLPGPLLSDIHKKLKVCEITKMILASIEIDGYRRDPNTGLWIATGNMNLQAMELTGRFSKSIGSANRSLSGRAEKKTDAARNALANASKAAADVVINQFNLR